MPYRDMTKGMLLIYFSDCTKPNNAWTQVTSICCAGEAATVLHVRHNDAAANGADDRLVAGCCAVKPNSECASRDLTAIPTPRQTTDTATTPPLFSQPTQFSTPHISKLSYIHTPQEHSCMYRITNKLSSEHTQPLRGLLCKDP